MTTITFDEDINLKSNYSKVSDFLWDLDYSLIYEEYLERKLQKTKNSSKDDFVNI